MKKNHPLVSYLIDFTLGMVLLMELFAVSCPILNYVGNAYNLYATIGDLKLYGLGGLTFLALVLLAYLCRPQHFRMSATILAVTLAFMLLALGCGFYHFRVNAAYKRTDPNLDQVFCQHKVMLIVPHEDDDINVGGGILEQYVEHGSEVYPVFVTNGDYNNPGETRIDEAIACMRECGIPEDHVIFLGYGDQWDDNGPHIYNSTSSVPIRSHSGHSQTYGSGAHPPYRNSPYTLDSYLGDLKSVILEYRPDVIYCIDYDSHIDHRATSLAFEKVFGRILREYPNYRPTVLKGFAYCTAWHAPADFYAKNILSTQNPNQDSYYLKDASAYHWNTRIRLPVSTSSLSRAISSSSVYQALNCYRSQAADLRAKKIINGDKVFWERNTSSLVYNAEIRSSSGNAALIGDFMLRDNYDLTDRRRAANDGVWVPERDDTDKSITIKLSAPSAIECVYLYDHPSATNNVLAARIILDNGKEFHSGPLDKYGAATSILIGEANVQSVTIVLEATEGDSAGLSEVEIYRHAPGSSFNFIKLMDKNGDFVYDYMMPDEKSEFHLYHVGNAHALSAEKYLVECDNQDCSVKIVGNRLFVTCPRGKSGMVSISSKDGIYHDKIYVSNQFNLTWFWQNLDDCLVMHLKHLPSKLAENFRRIPYFRKTSR